MWNDVIRIVNVDWVNCEVRASDIAWCEFWWTWVSDIINWIWSIVDLRKEIEKNNNISNLSPLINPNDYISIWELVSEQFVHYLPKWTVFNNEEYESEDFCSILTSYWIWEEFHNSLIELFKEKWIFYRTWVK